MLDILRQCFDRLSQRQKLDQLFLYSTGDWPVQRLNARLNALCSENPVSNAISAMLRSVLFRRFFAMRSCVRWIRSRKVTLFSCNLLVNVRLLIPSFSPIFTIPGIPLGSASAINSSTSSETLLGLISIPSVSSSTRSTRNWLMLASAFAYVFPGL